MAKYLRFLIILAVLSISLPSGAQRFFNLTSAQVSVDSVMPSFAYTMPLPDNYADSVYTATILYPEFIDMIATDVANYHKLSSTALPALPVLSQAVIIDRKRPMLRMSFCPLVFRNGKYQMLVSFMLKVEAGAPRGAKQAKAARQLSSKADRYAAHSVLRSGTWAKIRVPASGVYELTQSLIRRAGFSNLNRVHIYGYGGNLQDEVLDGNKLAETDDLHEVGPTRSTVTACSMPRAL